MNLRGVCQVETLNMDFWLRTRHYSDSSLDLPSTPDLYFFRIDVTLFRATMESTQHIIRTGIRMNNFGRENLHGLGTTIGKFCDTQTLR